MNVAAGCTPAAPGAGTSTTPPLGTSAPSAAHFSRLGRRSRRSSSSGASSSSSNGAVNASNSSNIVQGRRKRRRHSTLSSSGVASGSDEEAERAPPTFRLRLGSYVSDFRLARTRSHSPSSQQPPSPSGLVRQRHQLRIQTTAASEARDEQSYSALDSAISPTSTAPRSMVQMETTADMDMDLDVQSTFQAMQVDSPTASPSPTIQIPFFEPSTTVSAPIPAPALRSSRPSISPRPTHLLSPLITETRFPRSPSPLSSTSASLPSISLVANTSISTVSPAVYPSPTFLAARRNSRQSLSLNSTVSNQSQPHQQQLQQHTPASPSPLARTVSFQSHQHPHQHRYTPASSALSFQSFIPHQYQHFDLFQSPSAAELASTAPTTTSPAITTAATAAKSRSTSTPPSPIAPSSEQDFWNSNSNGDGGMLPTSPPLRRHSDGKPSPLRKYASPPSP